VAIRTAKQVRQPTAADLHPSRDPTISSRADIRLPVVVQRGYLLVMFMTAGLITPAGLSRPGVAAVRAAVTRLDS
jgi:hypothetical protein